MRAPLVSSTDPSTTVKGVPLASRAPLGSSTVATSPLSTGVFVTLPSLGTGNRSCPTTPSGSWFLVRVPESRCDFDDDTFEDRCACNVVNFRVCHCTVGLLEHVVSTGWARAKGKGSGQSRDQDPLRGDHFR